MFCEHGELLLRRRRIFGQDGAADSILVHGGRRMAADVAEIPRASKAKGRKSTSGSVKSRTQRGKKHLPEALKLKLMNGNPIAKD